MFLLKLFRSNTRNLLGRWNIQYNYNIISIKVDQANEDHCGVFIVKLPNEPSDEYYQAFLI